MVVSSDDGGMARGQERRREAKESGEKDSRGRADSVLGFDLVRGGVLGGLGRRVSLKLNNGGELTVVLRFGFQVREEGKMGKPQALLRTIGERRTAAQGGVVCHVEKTAAMAAKCRKSSDVCRCGSGAARRRWKDDEATSSKVCRG